MRQVCDGPPVAPARGPGPASASRAAAGPGGSSPHGNASAAPRAGDRPQRCAGAGLGEISQLPGAQGEAAAWAAPGSLVSGDPAGGRAWQQPAPPPGCAATCWQAANTPWPPCMQEARARHLRRETEGDR
jgi:hypothetical protein